MSVAFELLPTILEKIVNISEFRRSHHVQRKELCWTVCHSADCHLHKSQIFIALIINLLIEKGSENSLRESSSKVLRTTISEGPEWWGSNIHFTWRSTSCRKALACKRSIKAFSINNKKRKKNTCLWIKAEEFTTHLEKDCSESMINFKDFYFIRDHFPNNSNFNLTFGFFLHNTSHIRVH